MSKAMRDAFGDHLLALGKDHPELVVLDADVSRTQFGNGDFLDFDLFRAGQDGGLHGT